MRSNYRDKFLSVVCDTAEAEPSLAELAAWTDCAYSTAWKWLRVHERAGHVVVLNRGRNRIDGSQLIIRPRRPQ